MLQMLGGIAQSQCVKIGSGDNPESVCFKCYVHRTGKCNGIDSISKGCALDYTNYGEVKLDKAAGFEFATNNCCQQRTNNNVNCDKQQKYTNNIQFLPEGRRVP